MEEPGRKLFIPGEFLLARARVTNMLGEWILLGIAFVVLGLLDLLGWERAGKWLDQMVGEVDKEEKPVV
jgi:hypothetical protein